MGGGAGGHMWHPYDCPEVLSGADLVDVFKKSGGRVHCGEGWTPPLFKSSV